MTQDNISKAYDILSSLRNNLPNDKYVDEKYVQFFNQGLMILVNAGFTDIEEFKITDDEVKPKMSIYNPNTGTQYSKEKHMERGILLIKLDIILTYFQISQEKNYIGFKI